MRNFINENYIIDFPVPIALQDSMDMAEKADDENNYCIYQVYAENIDTLAKNCYVGGLITKKMWDTLIRRYEQ